MIDLFDVVIGVGLAVAASGDAVTTHKAIAHGAKESGIVLRGFDGSTPRLVGAQVGFNAGLFFISHKFKARHPRSWYAPVLVGAGMHAFAAVHNARVLRNNDIVDLEHRISELEKRRQQ